MSAETSKKTANILGFIGWIGFVLTLLYLLIFTPKNCPEFKPTNPKPLEPIKIDSTVIKTLQAENLQLRNRIKILKTQLNHKHENIIITIDTICPAIFRDWSNYYR